MAMHAATRDPSEREMQVTVEEAAVGAPGRIDEPMLAGVSVTRQRKDAAGGGGLASAPSSEEEEPVGSGAGGPQQAVAPAGSALGALAALLRSPHATSGRQRPSEPAESGAGALRAPSSAPPQGAAGGAAAAGLQATGQVMQERTPAIMQARPRRLQRMQTQFCALCSEHVASVVRAHELTVALGFCTRPASRPFFSPQVAIPAAR